jgi:hypothetical protein
VTIIGGTAMETCLTKSLMYLEVSGCLLENPTCCYANKFGFSYLCRHPDHAKFNAVTIGTLSNKQSAELYNELRKKRREEFLADQDETVRNLFSA